MYYRMKNVDESSLNAQVDDFALYSHYNAILMNTLEHFNVRRYNYNSTYISLGPPRGRSLMRSGVQEVY